MPVSEPEDQRPRPKKRELHNCPGHTGAGKESVVLRSEVFGIVVFTAVGATMAAGAQLAPKTEWILPRAGMRMLFSNRSILVGGRMLYGRPPAGWFIATVLCACYLNAQVAPDRLLRGIITRKDNLTYKLVPFTVPQGVKRITLEFTHTGAEQKTVIDLGLMGPDGFRGWSGARTGTLVVAETDATPSYLPGKIVPGTWNLLLGIPNIRPNVTATYTAKIYFSRSGRAMGAPAGVYPVISSQARWYRGDLHMHTAHSDGGCKSQNGKDVPCPVFFSIQAAAERGLDFIAITDHNTMSQYNVMREWQPYFDRLLLIPGRELTTFQGHANIFGTTDFVDFRVGSAEVPTWNSLLKKIHSAGGLVSINHPRAPTGEACLGCGWSPEPAADMRLVEVIEAINGTAAEGATAGIPFWQEQLNRGYQVTAIAGSDNHNGLATLPDAGSVGYPTTVVWASELSVPPVLQAIRAGHVFIDVTGSKDRLLEMSARLGDLQSRMGDTLRIPSGATAEFTLHVVGASGGQIEIIEDRPASPLVVDSRISRDDQSFAFRWKSDGQRHWLRANVRDPEGRLLLVGNPIYINFPENARRLATRQEAR
jgi:predicted metal-dependent phosphoesterase TrpH